MRKNNILAIFVGVFFITTNILNAAICVDESQISSALSKKKEEYKKLDRELADEINKITVEMNRGHNEIEVKSLETMMKIEELKKRYLLLENEILFNQENINELNSILVDMVGENANLKTGKRSLESIKRELLLK